MRAGTSPERTTTVPSKSSGSAVSPHPTAWPVPSCSSWTAISMRRSSRSASASTAADTCSRSGPSHHDDDAAAPTFATGRCRACERMLRPRQRVQHLEGVRPHPGTGAARPRRSPGTRPRCGHPDPPPTFSVTAPSPGLEPELSEPKSEVLPITPRRTVGSDCSRTGGREALELVSSDGRTREGSARPARRHDRHRAPSATRRDRQVAVRRAAATTARPSRRSPSARTCPSRSSTSTSAARKGCTPVVVDRRRCRPCSTGITSSLTNNPVQGRDRAGDAGAADLRRRAHRRVPDPHPGLAGHHPSGTYSTLLNDAVNQVASILAGDFSRRGLDPELAPLYAQALVGSVSMTAQWWPGRARAEEGGRGRAPGQPVLERAHAHLEDDRLRCFTSSGSSDVSRISPACCAETAVWQALAGECLRWTHHDRIEDHSMSKPRSRASSIWR